MPRIDGTPAYDLSTDAVLEAASAARESGDPARAAELYEYVIQHDYDRKDLSEVRIQAAESWFEAGRFEDAYEHDRRLMTEDPFTEHAEEISERAWTMGALMIRSKRILGDDREVGLEILNFLVTRFSRSRHADDAWKELALDAAAAGQHRASIDIYERLLRDHPESEWADLALFEAARSYSMLTRGKRYDVDPLLLAHAAFGRYLRRYPDGNFATDAMAERSRIEAIVSYRELEIAAYYRARQEVEGERVHLANAAARFPDTEAAQLARALLLEMDLDPAGTSEELLRPRQDQPIWRRLAERAAG